MSIANFDTEWVANWQKIQQKAWADADFKKQLLTEPRKTVTAWDKGNGQKGLPVIDNLALHINPDPSERFAHCVLAPIATIPHPTAKWAQEWPGIVALLNPSSDQAQRAKLIGNTMTYLKDLGLELLKHVRYSIDQDAQAHVIVMPLQSKDLPVSAAVSAILTGEGIGLDANGPYASSCCC